MRIGRADTESSVALVAEVGINHEGSLERAKEMVERASESGADAVKLQTFIPELYAPWGDAVRLEVLRRYQLNHEVTAELIDWAHALGITVFSTPFDLESAEFLLSRCSLVKVASGDLTFHPLIERLASSEADIIMSTGASVMPEVEEAFDLVRRHRSLGGSLPAILHCVSLYPADHRTLNLAAIGALKQRFPDAVIGYSDHSLGLDAAVLACGLGARVVEKHLTLDRESSDFRDHALSITPSELAMLRRRIDEAVEMLGEARKIPHPEELEMQNVIRRSIVLSRHAASGAVIDANQLLFLRPGTGISPRDVNNVIGRTLGRDVPAGTILQWGDFV